jgi:hypothetical protein
MADKADKHRRHQLAADRTDRQLAAARAHRRAAEAGARAAELRKRLTDLQAPTTSETNTPLTPTERSKLAAANALQRRDEAEERDRAAHQAAAQAHERAAAAYERLAATVSPDQQAEHLRKAHTHREAAKATHHHNNPNPH